MTPKWTIRKYSKTWPDNGPVWVVTAPDVRLVQEKVWVNNFLPSDRYKYCDTFAEAIAWATRKTRTVEVELPMTTPKLRYTKPPSMTYHVDVWCDGAKCDMQRMEHDGDGWMCDICGTFWDDPEGSGMDASESWGDELDGLPLYDEEGVKQ